MNAVVWAAFFIGIVFGVFGVIVFACCYVASEKDREEEERYDRRNEGN